MVKHLVIINPENCNGCELCVLESQRQLKKVGLNEALIRVFRRKDTGAEYIEHGLEIDPRVDSLDVDKINQICPKNVFQIEKTNND